VQVAANIPQAASTAFPPLLNIIEPAVAANGLPVMAIQFLPCKGGFWVCVGNVLNAWPFEKPLIIPNNAINTYFFILFI
jgi:hypothetical protein